MQLSRKRTRLIAYGGYSARYAELFLIGKPPDDDLQSVHDLVLSDLRDYACTLTGSFPSSKEEFCSQFTESFSLISYFSDLHSRRGDVDARDTFDFAVGLCLYFEDIINEGKSPEESCLAGVMKKVSDHYAPDQLDQVKDLMIIEGRRVAAAGTDNILGTVRAGVWNVVFGAVEIAENRSPYERALLPGGKKVFLVHGHDDVSKLQIARFLESLELTPIILHEQPNEGKTIIEKFVSHSNVAFALVLLTPDDIGHPKAEPEKMMPRARQNVVFELGYFAGSLGRRRVCVLYKEGVELPSDLHGVVYIPIDKEGAWMLSVGKEMRSAGLNIDLNATST